MTEPLGHVVDGRELLAAPARLAVDADADLDLVVTELERRGAGGGDDAADVRARPIERPRSLTFAAIAATSASDPPASAWAPAIFSTRTVTPTPRRPAVYSESWTATSSFVTTDWTSISPATSSAAIWKLRTSPV